MKNITILGSSGSIGRNALEVINNNSDRFNVIGLTVNNQIEILKEQILAFKPDIIGVAYKDAAEKLSDWISTLNRSLLNGKDIVLVSGKEGVCEVASYDKADIVISSIVGAAGLKPTLSAIRAGKDIGIANKETLVMAGEIVIDEVKKNKVKLFPVDSEHSAIFQCLEGKTKTEVKRIILTASGGPFWGKTISELMNVTAKDALNHPTWSMGNKITIDSATLMNKGLEVIEAHHLFGFPADRIDVLIHPQSIIHSLIEFNDRSLLAQLSIPDMKGPIAYALTYPERIPDILPRCNLEELSNLSFHKPDTSKFPCLKYAYNALDVGGTMPAVINAVNEVLVEKFLDNLITFRQIPIIIEEVMIEHNSSFANDLDVIFEADRWARERAKYKLKEKQ